MKKVSENELIRIKAYYTELFGVPQDDFSASVLYSIEQHSENLKAGLENTTKNIKEQVRPVQVNSKWEALCYGVGQYGLFGLALLICVFYGIYYHQTQTEFKEVTETVAEYPNLEKYQNIYKNGTTITKGNIEYMVVQPLGKEEFDFGTVYEYDSKNKRVLIPIRTK